MKSQLDNYLSELLDITEGILDLDLNDEESDGKLLEFQSEQIRIRDSINLILTDSHFTAANRETLEMCLIKEREIAEHLLQTKKTIEKGISKFIDGRRTRSSYNTESVYSMGFFIDSQR
ncbi:hypothetical protein MUG84_13505 [Paenibacillus sp. KQZ6P-2]|uniref:Uncharacterized protein n=1 Tax=Paenibacillus mangrovi TaxID=2931978 RepID=A0A9X1WSE2_9BACL|nr:hypothetical protein [Paenibacillus mangrovi]MCJ8012748.1 hypothetical protein [Paenibacillus mangrovi]